MEKPSKESEKAARERDIFTDFAAVARLPVVPGSVESRPAPEPDILCELVDRGRVAFELVRLVDEDLARHLARSETAGLWIDDPTLETVREKLTKRTYQTRYPMELIAHGDDLLLPYDVWLPKFEQRLKDLLERSKFRRLWIVNLTPIVANRKVWFVYPVS